MQIVQSRHFVKSEGVLDNKQFGIKFNAKMVKILSDGIYSDKILAIVRELSTNAYDSHVANGNEKEPFEVHLPSTFSSNFWIRDYGIGLSPDQVDEVYRIYGGSDKEDSNDYVGCLGLGSKTPFCYNTKTCTIDSWWGGKHYIYSAHIGEDGLPTLSLISEQPSNEKSGVKVTIPVNRGDYANFIIAAQKVYTWFKVRPKFIGQSVPTVPNVKYSLESPNGWGLREQTYGLHSGLIAVMGNVGYPVSFSDSSLKQEYISLFNVPITLNFNLGDLDIEASREGLSYDNRTKSNIVAKLKIIVDELSKNVEKELASCKYLYDARRKIATVLSKFSPQLQGLVPLDKLMFNGKVLFPNVSKNYYNQYSLTEYFPSTLDNKDLTLCCIVKRYNKSAVTHSRQFTWSANFGIVEADLKIGNQARTKEFLDKNQNQYDVLYLVNFADANQKKEFLELMGMDDSHLLKTSTFPQPPKTPRAKGGNATVKTTKIMQYNGRTSCGKSYCWAQTQKDLAKDSGYYVEFNQYSMYDGNTCFHPQDLGSIIEHLNVVLKFNDKNAKDISTVYGIKSAQLAKLSTNWINLFDTIEVELNKLVKEDKIFSSQKICEEIGKLGGWDAKMYISTPTYHTYKLIYNAMKKGGNTLFEKNMAAIDDLESQAKKYTNLSSCFNVLSKYCPIVKAPTTKVVNYDLPKKLFKEIEDKYPLLIHLNYNNFVNSYTNSYRGKYEDIVRYIEKIG